MPHRFVPWQRAVLWNQSRVEDAPNAAPDYESGGQEFESLRARQYLVPTQLLILQPVSGVVAPPSPTTRARRVARGSLRRKDMSLIFMSRITPALQPPLGYVAPQVA